MPYIPATQEELTAMLRTMGIERVDELFESVPPEIRLKGPLNLPPSMSEPDLMAHLRKLAGENASSWLSFLGGGIYPHYIPAVVDHLAGRAEFVTAYTPYQAEASQGTLQAIFEYQSLICMLSGMDISNASMYDGASALAEAALMACRASSKCKLLISAGVHPQYRAVVRTLGSAMGMSLLDIPLGENGQTRNPREFLDGETAAVLIQSPNYFGCIEDLKTAAESAHKKGALLVACATEALSLGLLKPPGAQGADIFVAEGQSFGLPQSFGGPLLGILAVRQEQLRRMPGRLVGQTVDRRGNTGYVLTLAAREQHIRREKATSNICTNESLMALRAAVYLCTLGPRGLREVARLNLLKARYARERIASLPGFRMAFSAPVFNEFTVYTPRPAAKILEALRSRRIHGGIDVSRHIPGGGDTLLICVTEMHSKEDIDSLCAALADGGREE
ncbi:MAG: aminomethyl-transferring glycine dehydrogenase subunit GcvPA [Deltaproteobacteria bacterium]|nr:aminomethyl-transferring glycine dehydrogenase subunit GcvPA [Deltaproteobacteria bacterium]